MKLKDGFFETPVSLKEGDITTFWVYARDGQGRLLETDTPEFKVRHGLVPSAPPLPHTLSVEVLNPEGIPHWILCSPREPLFRRKRRSSTALRMRLVPDKPDSDIAIKLWEGEFLDDPDANEWVGNVLLSHDGVRRSVPEGAEIEVTIQVDASQADHCRCFRSTSESALQRPLVRTSARGAGFLEPLANSGIGDSDIPSAARRA